MAVNKNCGFIEDIDESKLTQENIGIVDDVIRKASALQTCSKETVAYEAEETRKAVGGAREAELKAAGAENKGTAEGEVASHIATTGTVHTALDVTAAIYKDATLKDPAEGRDVASASKKMGGMIGGGDVTSFEKLDKTAFVIDTGPWQKATTKAENVGEFFKATKDVTTNSINQIEMSSKAVTSRVQSTGIASAQKLAKALDIKREIGLDAPTPGGMGGGAQRVAQNSMNTFMPRSPLDGPKGPTNVQGEEVV